MDSLFTAGMIPIPQGCRINKVSAGTGSWSFPATTTRDIELAPNVTVIQAFYLLNSVWKELIPGVEITIADGGDWKGFFYIHNRTGHLLLRTINNRSENISTLLMFNIIYSYV